MSFDIENFRKQFPLLSTKNRFGKPLIYFDNAAMSQIPKSVSDAIHHHICNNHANVHRGIYDLSAKAEKLFESTRTEIAQYINAKHPYEIIFNSGTTDGINFLAHQFQHLTQDDEILLSLQEHHSNILPWQQLKATVKFVNMTSSGDFDFEDFEKKLSKKTKIVSVAHICNVLGTINPIKEIAAKAHEVGAICVVDGAQSLAHGNVNMQDFDCDFFVSSCHKFHGPTGIGFLYGKLNLLKKFKPYRLGGGTIDRAFIDKPSILRELPYIFEAGTPNIIGVAGMNATIQFLKNIDWNAANQHTNTLREILLEQLYKLPKIKVLYGNGGNRNRAPIVSWTHNFAHPHDVASILDSEGIAVRAGNHCASILMKILNITGCVRVSFLSYNTQQEIYKFIESVEKIDRIFGGNI